MQGDSCVVCSAEAAVPVDNSVSGSCNASKAVFLPSGRKLCDIELLQACLSCKNEVWSGICNICVMYSTESPRDCCRLHKAYLAPGGQICSLLLRSVCPFCRAFQRIGWDKACCEKGSSDRSCMHRVGAIVPLCHTCIEASGWSPDVGSGPLRPRGKAGQTFEICLFG